MNNFHKSIQSFLKSQFGIVADKTELFEEAFTHSSYKVYGNSIRDYERLELLGDSFISIVITEKLYFKNCSLKDICNLRKEIVCGSSLSWVSDYLNLYKYIRLGKSCSITNSIKEDIYESFVGALYLTFGYDVAKKIVLDTLYKNFEINNIVHVVDYKTKLQEFVQSTNKNVQIKYVLNETGTHDKSNHVFEVFVYLGEEKIGTGMGYRVKEAEQKAAQQALIKFNKIQKF